MDNYEKTLLRINPDACIRCATCTAMCPVSRVTSVFPGPKQAGPGAERFRKISTSLDEWIDLCIGCNLCNLACPSGVPISELNLMAKAKYLDEKGRPLRDWILSHIYLFGKLGSLLSPIINRALRNSFLKWLLDTFLKIERKRELPLYQTPTFRKWFKRHRLHKAELAPPPFNKGKMNGRKVAYFYGCYINTNEVDVGKATVQVLEAIGLDVILPHQRCCGIPMLGNGDFRGAKRLGLKNVESLLKAFQSGYDIIFSSTSCGYMIKHEYSHLLNIPKSEELSRNIFDIFEYLRNMRESGNIKTEFKSLSLKAAYFAPCHLRSLGIGLPALEIIRLIPGLHIEKIEADCCGLGGMFGFKKERYEISEEIGKDLLEAIKRLKPEVILTDCEGCRIQIRDLTGLNVLHPIQILRDVMT